MNLCYFKLYTELSDFLIIRCPDLVLLPPCFDKYKAVNALVRDVLEQYDPGVRSAYIHSLSCNSAALLALLKRISM